MQPAILQVVPETPQIIRCPCGAEPRLAHKILDPRKGGMLCMFKCQCGQQIWVNRPE